MNKYLEMALEVAQKSKCRHRHGAVVVYNGRIIAAATNKKVADPERLFRRAIHAEQAALIAAGNRARGSVLYVARAAADGSPATSKPCKKCERFLNRSGVSQVVWT